MKLKFIPSNIFLVGGSVRDFLLKRKINDYDFVLKTSLENFHSESRTFFKKNFNKHGFLIGKTFPPTMRGVLDTGEKVDITLMQNDFEEDALRRDFTINSLYYDLNYDKIIDHLNGIKDIEERKIKISSESSFRDDPLRLLRAFRLLGQLTKFSICKSTYLNLLEHAGLIQNVAVERVREELEKIFIIEKRYVFLKYLLKTKLLFFLFPELKRLEGLQQKCVHKFDVLNHSLNILKFIPDKSSDFEKKIYSYVALFHDLGKYDASYCHEEFSVKYTKEIVARLKMEKAVSRLIINIVKNHMKILHISLNKVNENTLKKLVFEHYDILDYLIQFVIMESNTKVGSNDKIYFICEKLRAMKNDFLKKKKNIDNLVTGNDVVAMGIKGEQIGKLLNKIRFIIYRDNIDSKETALKILKGLM